MAARERGSDRRLDPDFGGDFIDTARSHPVWIIDSAANTPLIDAAWNVGEELSLCEVHRLTGDSIDLIPLLPMLHSHHNWSALRWNRLIVRGMTRSAELQADLAGYGFPIRDVYPNYFTTGVPGVSENTWDFGGLFSPHEYP